MMEQRNNNKPNGNRNNTNNRPVREEVAQKPKRKQRVNIDRNTEVVVVNNELGRFIFDNPRMITSLDMLNHGDEDYITVADLRVILNTSRKVLEGFSLLITEVVNGEYELEDVLVYLGLDKAYEEYFSISPEWKQGNVQSADIKEFIQKSKAPQFKIVLETVDVKLRNKIIEASVALFKLGQFGDYQKMQAIRKLVNDDLFLDAEETEIDEEVIRI